MLCRTGKIEVPEYRDIVKLARFNELAPTDDDWYYIRAGLTLRFEFIIVNVVSNKLQNKIQRVLVSLSVIGCE